MSKIIYIGSDEMGLAYETGTNSPLHSVKTFKEATAMGLHRALDRRTARLGDIWARIASGTTSEPPRDDEAKEYGYYYTCADCRQFFVGDTICGKDGVLRPCRGGAGTTSRDMKSKICQVCRQKRIMAQDDKWAAGVLARSAEKHKAAAKARQGALIPT